MGWAALYGIASSRAQLEARWLAAPRDLRKGMKQADVAKKYGVSEAFRLPVGEGPPGGRDGSPEDADDPGEVPGKTPHLTEEQFARLQDLLAEGVEDGRRQDVGFLRMALSVIG